MILVAVLRGRSRVHERLEANPERGTDEGQGSHEVRPDHGRGVTLRRVRTVCCKVEDPIGSGSLQGRSASVRVREIDLMELEIVPDVVDAPGVVVLSHEQVHGMTLAEESPHQVRPDEPGPPGDDGGSHLRSGRDTRRHRGTDASAPGSPRAPPWRAPEPFACSPPASPSGSYPRGTPPPAARRSSSAG